MLEELRERPDRGEQRGGLPAEQHRRRDDEDVEERDASRVGALDGHRKALGEHRGRQQRGQSDQARTRVRRAGKPDGRPEKCEGARGADGHQHGE